MRHPRAHRHQNVAHSWMRMFHLSVMHPFSLASGIHQPCPSQIGEMSRYLRLHDRERAREIANTNFSLCQQVQKAQARRIRECFKNPRSRRRYPLLHSVYIYVYTYMSNDTEVRESGRPPILDGISRRVSSSRRRWSQIREGEARKELPE